MPGAYYNEIDEFAAEWLRNLILLGHIADGDVDTRSISEVHPDDLRGYTQCHFFAGIGVWSLALRRAGWPDDRAVWTGSCPCQPFSVAGAAGGFDDQRHLWPHWHHLIRKRRPAKVFGEQVASADGLQWLDLVLADLEGEDYAVGAADLCAAGVGAPHIRQRLWFVADANHHRRAAQPVAGILDAQRDAEPCGGAGGVAHPVPTGWPEGRPFTGVRSVAGGGEFGGSGVPSGGVADARCQQRERGPHTSRSIGEGQSDDQCGGLDGRPGPTNGIWADADWILCRDGKWRPVEASSQPLVDGSAESLGRVRPEVLAQVEKEVNAATAQTEGGRSAAMRALLEDLGAQAKRCWPLGGLPGLHEAPFLLAFVRQLQDQGWQIAEGIALPRSEASSGLLRSLWHDQAAAGASHRRELAEQRPGEPADVVRVLSCLLARNASAAWGDAHAAHAEIGFPLGHNAHARVGRLRAYGNAINAEAAATFVRATL